MSPSSFAVEEDDTTPARWKNYRNPRRDGSPRNLLHQSLLLRISSWMREPTTIILFVANEALAVSIVHLQRQQTHDLTIKAILAPPRLRTLLSTLSPARIPPSIARSLVHHQFWPRRNSTRPRGKVGANRLHHQRASPSTRSRPRN